MMEVGDIQLLWCAMSLCDILKSHNGCLYPLSYLLPKPPVSLPPVFTVHPTHLHTLLNWYQAS